MAAFIIDLEDSQLTIDSDRYHRIFVTKKQNNGDVYEMVFSIRSSVLFAGFLSVAQGTHSTIEIKTAENELYFDVLDRKTGKFNIHIKVNENKMSFNLPVTVEQLNLIATNCEAVITK